MKVWGLFPWRLRLAAAPGWFFSRALRTIASVCETGGFGVFALVAGALWLVGCNGSDTGQKSYPDIYIPPGANTPLSTTWREQINLDAARRRGILGTGIVIALVDTGIDRDHSAFIDAIMNESVNLSSARGDFQDPYGHGTEMAGILIGGNESFYGVAPRARVLAINTASPTVENMLEVNAIARGIIYAADHGAQIINLSIGGNIGRDARVNEALEYAAARGVILISATGNGGHDATVRNMAMGAGEARFGGHLIGVTAVDDDNVLAGFATPCDVYDPNYCLAAPGVRLDTTRLGGGYGTVSGTSPATAVVAGTAALLLEYWQDLTPAEIAEILLVSARDLGAPGVDRVYGRGLVDVEAALSPIGDTRLANGAMTGDLAEARIHTSAAGGNAIAASFDDLVLYDAFDRDFSLDLSARIQDGDYRLDFGQFFGESFAGTTIQLTEQLRATMRAGAVGGNNDTGRTLRVLPSAITTNPFAGVVGFDYALGAEYQIGIKTALKAGVEIGGDGDNRFASIGVTHGTATGWQFGLGLGLLRENGAALGMRTEGSFGTIISAQSQSVSAKIAYAGQGFDAFVLASHSATDPRFVSGSIGQGLDRLDANLWSAGIGFDGLVRASDRLDFAFGQSLGITEGQYHFDDGLGIRALDLAQKKRASNVEIGYSTPIGRAFDLGVHIFRQFDDAKAGTQIGISLNYNL